MAASDEAATRLGRAGDSLARYSEEAAAASERNAAKLGNIGSLIYHHAEEAGARIDHILAKTDSTHAALRGQLHELADTYDKAEQGIEALAGALSRRSGDMGDITDRALGKMETWDKTVGERTRALDAASDKVAEQTQGVIEAIDNQTRDMRAAASEAETLLGELRAETHQAGVDDFLRRATFISERLQSLAVDMNRVLETRLSEDDWRRFNRGEKGVFVRKMLGFREKSKLASVKKKYEDDGEFRDYVGRYISQFDAMLADARKRDHDAVLSTTFLSSDMGKVYMLLAWAIGREF